MDDVEDVKIPDTPTVSTSPDKPKVISMALQNATLAIVQQCFKPIQVILKDDVKNMIQSPRATRSFTGKLNDWYEHVQTFMSSDIELDEFASAVHRFRISHENEPAPVEVWQERIPALMVFSNLMDLQTIIAAWNTMFLSIELTRIPSSEDGKSEENKFDSSPEDQKAKSAVTKVVENPWGPILSCICDELARRKSTLLLYQCLFLWYMVTSGQNGQLYLPDAVVAEVKKRAIERVVPPETDMGDGGVCYFLCMLYAFDKRNWELQDNINQGKPGVGKVTVGDQVEISRLEARTMEVFKNNQRIDACGIDVINAFQDAIGSTQETKTSRTSELDEEMDMRNLQSELSELDRDVKKRVQDYHANDPRKIEKDIQEFERTELVIPAWIQNQPAVQRFMALQAEWKAKYSNR